MLLAAGVAPVPLCGFVTTSSDPATEPGKTGCCWSAGPPGCGGVGTPWLSPRRLERHPRPGRCWARTIVLWRTPDGRLRCAVDRCPHRWAQLSKGTVTDGRLVCPYHGWQFGPDGAVVEIPQLEAGAPLPPSACLQVLPTAEAYGMAWISLEPHPPAPIPTIPEFEDPRFDRIEIGVIRYHASAAAIIDNNTDSTHVAFVHSGSFGADQDPRVPIGSVQRSSFGISISYGEMPVARIPTSQQPGTRHSVTEMWMPFVQVGRMHYSDGSTHILVKGCCPVQDGVTDVHLTVLRNDLGRLHRPAIHHRLRDGRRARGQSRPRNASRGLPPRPETAGPHQARPPRHRLPPRPHRLPRRPGLGASQDETAGLAASANALRRSGFRHGRSCDRQSGLWLRSHIRHCAEATGTAFITAQ